MSLRLHQITHDDLQTLEECVPQLTQLIGENTNNATRVLIRRVQDVLTRVRWEYQPWQDIKHIDAGDDCDELE